MDSRGRGRPIINDYQQELRRPNVIPAELLSAVANQPSGAQIFHGQPNPAMANHENFRNISQEAQQRAIYEAYSGLPQRLATLGMGNGTSDVAKSIFNPNAPEFVPRNYQADPPPVANHSPQLFPLAMPSHTYPQMEFMGHPVIDSIDKLIVTLTHKPFKFQEIASRLTNIVSEHVDSVNFMQEIVLMIFEQGVYEENFRYSGARLCQYLQRNVRQRYTGLGFKELLLRRCQDEYNHRDFYLSGNPSRLIGITFFICEVFTNFANLSEQIPEDVEFLRVAVCKLAITLLKNPNNDHLKCVVKVLKASGSALDASNSKHLDEVMQGLKDLTVTAQLTLDIKAMLLNLIELRASNWGVTNEAPSTPASTPDMPPLGTVYYSADGQIQRVVLDEADDYSEDDNQLSQPNDSYSLVETLYGEEADAFEQFLRSQKKN